MEAFLLSATQNASEQQLLRIVETLGETRASSPETLDFLQQQVRANNPELLIASCRSLERIGSAPHSTLPMLIAIAERPRVQLVGNENGKAFRESRDTTRASLRAILAIGANESAVPVLTDCLAIESHIATAAAAALAEVGPAAASALPALQKLQNRDDHGGRDMKTKLAREAASKAIIAIKPDED